MTKPSIDDLNQQFAFESPQASFLLRVGDGGIPVLEVKNQLAEARISLQGAHLLSWVPRDESEVIWLSEDATFSEDKSVRGGIPICWPWFGAHQNNEAFPAHGFARTVMWELTGAKQLVTGETQIKFTLNTEQLSEQLQKMWPNATSAQYTVTVGENLRLELKTTNNSAEDIIIGEALHTYFNVGDISKTQVEGLDGKEYLDKPDNFKRKKQTGLIEINEEVDRVYLQTPDDIFINNQQRKIKINKQGSYSTVVWNPWEAVAEKMGDLGEGGYLQMLCVESANAAEDVIHIKAGQSHTLNVTYSLQDS